jgi:hypothetical protein
VWLLWRRNLKVIALDHQRGWYSTRYPVRRHLVFKLDQFAPMAILEVFESLFQRNTIRKSDHNADKETEYDEG